VDTEQEMDAKSEVEHGCTSASSYFIRNTPSYSFAPDHYRRQLISSTILTEIRDLVLSTKPKYMDVLALDRKLRECAVKLFGAPVGAREASNGRYELTYTYA
jgi:hypothetical protein